ncbi:MAG: type II secretion system protein [Gloeobacteraceae cyanobacterium ES-bin-144]|nr:type II secretion system protein [Verrucomicrobiales bacterium]
MKQKPSSLRPTLGFTLVEMLVVITIIASLAAIAFTVGPKMKKRGDSAKSIQNMRQIGAMVGVYTADNSMKIPALKVESVPPGGVEDVLWHEGLLFLAYPDVERSKIKWDTAWWNANQPFLRNPVMTATSKPKAFKPWFNGYAYNYQITAKLGNYKEDFSPSLSSISEPERTPFVVPFWNTRYGTGDISGTDMKSFLVDKKMSVLFVDGHVEAMTPKDYLARKLNEMPKKP